MKRTHPEIYLFCTGLVRAMEGRLFTPETVRRLINAGTLPAAMDILKGTLAGDFIKTDESVNINRMILSARSALLSFTENLSHDSDMISILRAPYDFHNIRIILKSKILETETLHLSELRSVPVESIKYIFDNEDYDKFPHLVQNAILAAVEEYYTHKIPSVIDFIMDSAMFSYISQMSESLGSVFISDYFSILTDITNISSFFRLQRMDTEEKLKTNIFIPHGQITAETFIKTGDRESLAKDIKGTRHAERLMSAADEFETNPFVFEREADIIIRDELKKTAFLIHGVEPLFALYERINMELKAGGIILSCYNAGLGPDFMRLRISEAAFE